MARRTADGVPAPAASDAALALATDPATDSAQLAGLLRHRSPEVRRAVVSNPNTPWEVLGRVAAAAPEGLVVNPLLQWMVVEDPDFLRGLAPRVRHRLLACAAEGLLWWAARFGADDDRLAALANPDAPAELVVWLAGADPSAPPMAERIVDAARHHVAYAGERPSGARQGVVGEPGLSGADSLALDVLLSLGAAPGWLVPAACASPNANVRLAAARHPECPPSGLRALLLDDDPEVRDAAVDQAQARSLLTRELALLGGDRRVGRPAGTDRPGTDRPGTGQPGTGPPDTELDAGRLDAELDDDGALDDELVSWLRTTELGTTLLTQRRQLPASVIDALVASGSWRDRRALAASSHVTYQHAVRLAADDDNDVRAALAANPRCAPDVLAALALDGDDKVRASLADRDAVPSPTGVDRDLLAALAAAGSRGAMLAATHDASDPGLLDQLSGHGDWRVREACARSLRTAPATLARLADDNDHDVRAAAVANPARPPGLAEAKASDAHPRVRAACAAVTDDAELLDALAADGDEQVRVAAATNLALGELFVVRLADACTPASCAADPSTAVALAERPSVPAAVLAHLAALGSSPVAVALADRADLPDEIWARLCTRGDDVAPARAFVRALTAMPAPTSAPGGPDAGREVDPVPARSSDVLWSVPEVAAVLGREPWLLDLATTVDPLPATALEPLAAHASWRIRERVALADGCPPEVLRQLADDNDYDVRKAVAANPSTPADVVALLAADTTPAVRLGVLRHPAVASERIIALACDADESVRAAALTHPACPSDVRHEQFALEHGEPVTAATIMAASSGEVLARVLLARHPLIDGEHVNRLAGDDSWRVREALAGNVRSTQDTLVLLAADADRDVRRAVASNPVTPPALLVELAADGDDDVVRRVVRRVRADRSLAPARDALVRRALRAAVRSESVTLRAAAAACPSLVRTTRRHRGFWQAIEWPVRYGVATNPATEPDVLGRLAADADVVVRAAARERLATHTSTTPPTRRR